jgi:predicted DNA-binding transcriptional regulator AlpA
MKLLTREGIAEKLNIKTSNSIKEIVESETFPLPIVLPACKRDRWLEHEVDQWIASLANSRPQGKTA